MKSKFKLITILVLFSLAGCSGLSGVKPLDYSEDNITDGGSLIFGYFNLDQKGGQVTGLWVEVENTADKSTFLFPLEKEKTISAIPVAPAMYRIKQFYFAKGGVGGPATWFPSDFTVINIPEKYSYLSSTFIVEPNQAVYLADIFGITMFSGRNKLAGAITNIEQNYMKSKDEFTKKYSSVKGIALKSAFPSE